MSTDWLTPPPPTSPNPTTAEAAWLRTATTMSLGAITTSPAALSLLDAIVPHYLDHESVTRKNARRETGKAKLRAALGVIVGGVLRPWGLWGTPVYKVMGTKALAGPVSGVGAPATRSALDTMVALGFIIKANGRQQNLQWADGARTSSGIAPRFWPSPELLTLATHYGITPDSLKGDFRIVVPQKAPEVLRPVELREMGAPGQHKARKVPIPVDFGRSTEARRLRDQVERFNEFAGTFTVDGCEAPRWRRLFTSRWDLGGRWYAAGSDHNYQNFDEGVRLLTLGIGGESVVEVDIGASHLTIMHSLLGLSLPSSEDLYATIPFPRKVVKAWVTATVGKGSAVVAWSAETKKKTPEVMDHDARVVGAATMAHYPFLKAPGDAVKDVAGLSKMSKIATPGRLLSHWLMGTEARAITDAMEALRAAGVLALPMHDALIVGASHADAATVVLREKFAARVGIVPRLKLKRSGL